MGIYETINLMTAFELEHAKKGTPNENELIKKILAKDIELWKELYPRYEFVELSKLADRGEDVLNSIIENGYKVTYITLPGLKRLLEYRFGLIVDEHYTELELGLKDIKITTKQLEQLKIMLSSNWLIEEHQDGTISISV